VCVCERERERERERWYNNMVESPYNGNKKGLITGYLKHSTLILM